MRMKMKEVMKLTLLPVNNKGKLVKKTQQDDDSAVKIWDILYCSNTHEGPFAHYHKDETTSDKKQDDQTPAVDDDDTDADKPVDFVRETEDWDTYHPDILMLSTTVTTFVYQLEVTHPLTGLRFKRFYYRGTAQFCETLTDTFDNKRLI